MNGKGQRFTKNNLIHPFCIYTIIENGMGCQINGMECKWKFNENGYFIILNAQTKREVIGSSQKKYSHGP
jgi:hypothetical protein